ncbi:MAG: glycosyl hydrolase 115 family protein [Bacteroidales bacterium]|nr:glycosyl hydrolase 115 family protein [Bacteroidales bacterium]
MKFLTTLLLFLLIVTNTVAADFVWYNGTKAVDYQLMTKTSTVADIAIDMFASDMEAVTGKRAVKVKRNATIRIWQVDKMSPAEVKKLQLSHDVLNSFDAFYIRINNNAIEIYGNNGRGVAYGILELSRMAGVSPWIWWGDATPEHKDRLTLEADFQTFQAPSVKYRGIFINDEDWSSRVWSEKNIEHGVAFGPTTYKLYYKLLLRLRANTLWPAMHPGTVAFFAYEDNRAAADSFSIIIGTSHCEPMLRNNVGEWDFKQRGDFNYISNQSSVDNYWRERVQETRNGEYIYTLGMRGIHDDSMEGVNTLDEKTAALQKVIDNQRNILSKEVTKNVEQLPQIFVPYKEVLLIMENGLKVPDDVTLMWCDDNYGYLTRLSNDEQRKRSGESGVYYHLSYWGRPHDYLWLTTTQPGLLYHEMRTAYDHGAKRIWIVNVHDVRAAAYQMELFLDMAWNINCVNERTLNNHMQNWYTREFCSEQAKAIVPIMREYYRLTAIRKPEFMGWNQVELSKTTFDRGLSPVRNTEFTDAFGGETERYIAEYKAIADEAFRIAKNTDNNNYDKFFAFVKYPINSAALMAEKMLYAQKARQTEGEERDYYSTKSLAAYNHIQFITSHYNEGLSNGKWNGLMCSAPRDLFTFYPPLLPSLQVNYNYNNGDTAFSKPTENFIARNASSFNASQGNICTIDMLGHSMSAVAVDKNGHIDFDFETDNSYENAQLYVAVIPTQPNDTGDIRFSVAIDNGEEHIISIKEPFRSERWKTNVLRGQALRSIDVNIPAGKHKLTLRALDDHIVFDQWMLDEKRGRKFYVIPVNN